MFAVQLDKRSESSDGHEMNFAVNTLGTFAITHKLQTCLSRGGPGSRVITVTSGGAYTAPLVIDDLAATQMQPYDGMTQYARDKRRQMAIMERFAEKLALQKVGCYLMHPGKCLPSVCPPMRRSAMASSCLGTVHMVVHKRGNTW